MVISFPYMIIIYFQSDYIFIPMPISLSLYGVSIFGELTNNRHSLQVLFPNQPM